MANNSLIFSSPAGSTLLVGGRNQIATFPVGNLSSIRVYAFVRPNTPQVTLYLINPDSTITSAPTRKRAPSTKPCSTRLMGIQPGTHSPVSSSQSRHLPAARAASFVLRDKAVKRDESCLALWKLRARAAYARRAAQ
jgi:hypothetical protein